MLSFGALDRTENKEIAFVKLSVGQIDNSYNRLFRSITGCLKTLLSPMCLLGKFDPTIMYVSPEVTL